MIHHERLRPPAHDYPADEWHLIEKSFHPEFLAQAETVLALGNGYLGMRGCPEEGGPHAENGTFINGFYETWPIVYGEDAYGFAKTGQTIVNVTDSKIIKLFVDDEPFWLPTARCLRYDRRLNMRSGTLDRELLWETPAGTQVLISSRRLVSFVHRHVAAISYQVTLLNAAAPVVIASEMMANQPHANAPADDPRQARAFVGRVLHPRASYARERRLVLCHATAKSQLILACATDHDLETACPYAYKVVHTEDFGQVTFTIEAQPGAPIHLTKYMVYHTSPTASPAEVCGRAEWTMDRVMQQGFPPLLAAQEQYLEDFWRRSDVRIRNIDSTRFQRSTVEIQQAIRFNLFHIVQASARADNAGVPAKGLTGQAYEGHAFWDTEIYLLPFLIYTSPRIARNLLTVRYQMLPQARARARELGHKGHVPVAHHQRRRSVGLLRRRHRSVPHQRGHHVRAPQVCTGHRRRALPAGVRRRDARGNGTPLAGPGLLLGAEGGCLLHQRRHRARRIQHRREQQRLHQPDGAGEPALRRRDRRGPARHETGRVHRARAQDGAPAVGGRGLDTRRGAHVCAV
jgi:alpha,alpha-trehalose phosphorylase